MVHVYAATTDMEDDEIEHFYHDLEQIMKQTKKYHTIIVMGDFNVNIGQGRVKTYVDDYGLGECNELGDNVLQFCQTEDMRIANTFLNFLNEDYIWKSSLLLRIS